MDLSGNLLNTRNITDIMAEMDLKYEVGELAKKYQSQTTQMVRGLS